MKSASALSCTASSLSQLRLAKELSPTVNTSLDLSINSFRHLENHPAASPSPDRRARHWINPALNLEEDIKEDNYDSDTRRERPAAREEGIVSVEEFDRIVSENKKLTELLSTMYTDMRTHNAIDPKSTGNGSMTTRKRKHLDDYEWTNVIGTCESSINRDDDMYWRTLETGRTNVFRVYAQVDPSDMSLIVRDGYHWRKYGQKVTRDNPSPRAYFKCSFAPSCPVKKKVQRSVDDPSLLVATYEGRHNHPSPNQRVTVSPNISSPQGHPKPVFVIPSSPTVTTGGPSTPSAVLDPVQPPGRPTPVPKQTIQETNHGASVSMTDGFPRLFVQQMASSLTRDPSFKAALAAAISGWIVDQEPPENR